MTDVVLKPCPFCGDIPIINGRPRGAMGQVVCVNEDCFGPRTTAATKADSIIQWNTRADPTASAIRAAIERFDAARTPS